MTRARSLSQLANSNVFSVDANNSRVGIASTLPTSTLNVVGVISATSFYGSGTNLTGVASTENIITGTAATFNNQVTIQNLYVGAATTIQGTLTYEDVTNVDAIGLSTFRAGVHISQSSSPTLRLNLTDSSVSADQTIGRIEFKANDGSADGSQVTGAIESVAQAAFSGQGSPSYLVFSTNGVSGADALAERLRIDSSGNVGINSTNPAYLLDIASGSASMRLNSTSTSTLVITSGASNAARIEFGDLANNDTGYIYYDNSDDSMRFATNGSTERARINSSGDLIVDAGGDAQDIQIKSHSANSGHGIIYMRGNASGERSSIQLNHFGYADWLISAGGTGNGEFSITNTDQGTDGIKLNSDGDLLPAADNSLDLGSASLRWANIYSADLQLSNEGSVNDVDGTWGQYTIQEGENDLFLLNRRNGKTYKFVLQEVD
jgi:hypothetical protein